MKIYCTDPVKHRLFARVRKQTPEDLPKKRPRKRRVLPVALAVAGLIGLVCCLSPETAFNVMYYIFSSFLAAVGILYLVCWLLILFLIITSPAWGCVFVVRAGANLVEKRKAKKQAQDDRKLPPRTSLLRGAQAPGTAQEVLVRPILETCPDADPQQLLRAVGE